MKNKISVAFKKFGTAVLAVLATTVHADLLIDFQPAGGNTTAGYESFTATNQSLPVTDQTYSAFGSSVTVSLTTANLPDGTADFRAVTRNGLATDIFNDWIGVDTRSGGVDVTMSLTFTGIPSGTYEWLSYHEDGGTGAGNGNLDGECDYSFTDAEGTRSGIIDLSNAFDSTTGTFTNAFVSDGSNTVSFTMVMDEGQGGSSALFAFIGGLEISGPMDRPTDLSLSNLTIGQSALIGTTVGTFSTVDPTENDAFTYTLATGNGDDDNSYFAIVEDQLETNRFLSEATDPLSIRVRSTDFTGHWIEKVILLTLMIDEDVDGLADEWELIYFPDLSTATGSGHNDGDTLTNLEEQNLGSNPTLTDTDGDTLNDDRENNSRIFVSVDNPGSSPLLTDTDDDGIDDAAELSLDNGYITNPNKKDSDDDGFQDPLELAEGTDPTNSADFPNTFLPLRINELLARNSTGQKDGFGNKEDWIEIYNPNNVSINLNGYYLTDNAALLTKWAFPEISIAANGFLLIFASGKDLIDPQGHPHCSFNLSADGEYLAIIRPNGSSIDDALNFPEQFSDISYGRHPSTEQLQFYAVPSPLATNPSTGYPGVAKDTAFSTDRGFYNTAFPLIISSATTDATIRYTLDGSDPSENGTVFNPAAPLDISKTTVVRAVAEKTGWLSSNTDSHSYIFVDDVAIQPADPPGWPTDWSNCGSPDAIQPADYEMDQRVVNNTNGLGEHTIQEALLDIPSVSIAMKPEEFLNAEGEAATGIYSNPLSRWERYCSVEYLLPDGSPGFQEDCKIEVHGNSSRNPVRMHKHSLRLTFSSEIGVPTLQYPLFPDSKIEEFNKLVLRACFTDSWALVSWSSSRYRPNDSQYIRDVWMKDSLKDMGQPSSYGNFVHLYINGLYFGLHNLTERLEDDFFAQHLGGEKEDWLINSDFSTAPARWSEMMTVLDTDISSLTTYEAVKPYIDLENYADYMLLHFYADAEDWPHHNGYAAANLNSGDGKFRFFVWDQEIVLDKFTWNRYSSDSGGGQPFQRLRLNPEFKILFADRVQEHLFDDGALSESASINRYMDRANEIDKAIMAESARWGDIQETVPYADTPSSSIDIDADYYPPLLNDPIYFTREQHWITERNNITGHYIPTLHDETDSRSIIRELRSNNLFPAFDAPTFSQHGGEVSSAFRLTMFSPVGEIYYTLDGTDPRLPGGSLNPAALLYANNPVSFALARTTVKARVLNGTDWSAMHQATFLVDTIAASADNVIVSEIHYNPMGPDDTEFIELLNTGAEQIDLNGVSLSTAIDFTFGEIILAPGSRVVVVEDIAAFSNFYQTATSPYHFADIQVAGQWQGALANDSETILLLDKHQAEIQSITYKDSGAWPGRADGRGSSLEAHDFNVPANRSDHWQASHWMHGSPGRTDNRPNIVINELQSHSNIGHDWVELKNCGTNTVDLSGWYLSDDLDTPLKYQISGGTTLDAGAFLLINETSFNTGSNAFSFSELGEEIALTESDGTNVIRIVGYKDFGAAEPDITFGRYLRSDQRDSFTSQQTASPGTTNDMPRLEAVRIGEIIVHPTNGLPEYVELVNMSGTAALLYDAAIPTNLWKLTSAINFTVPAGTSIPAYGRILITSTNAAAFRTAYAVPAEIQVLGPWSGKLDNAQESIRLKKPGNPELDGTVPYILVEKVDYRDYAPWPSAADGSGAALQRLDYNHFANDPANWYASGPATPGQGPDLETYIPNKYPVLNLPESIAAQEDVQLKYQIAATDPDVGQSLTFLLEPGAPATAQISADGLLTWMPSELDGPGTVFLKVTVADDGAPNLSTAAELKIVVAESNTAPVLQSGQTTVQTNYVTILAQQSNWNYLDDGNDAGTAWREPLYDDSTWANGPAPLGYGDAHIKTTVSYGSNSSAKHITTYFRTAFELTENLTALELGLLRDDSAVIYLNGTEILRDNLTTNAISYTTLAIVGMGGTDESTYTPYIIDPGLLQLGTNILAAEVHQASQSSSDLGFDIYLLGQVTQTNSTGITDQTVDAGELIRFVAAATDTDVPQQTIEYGLTANAPNSAHINPLSGEFSWAPTEYDGPALIPITITATDNGQPALQGTKTFTVKVIAPFNIYTGTEGNFSWATIIGDDYRVEYKDDLLLPQWELLTTFTATEKVSHISDPDAALFPQRFYRIIWLH